MIKSRQGFTLLELVVVVALLAMFSTISLPLLMNHGDGGERRVLRLLAGTVKQLYNEATLTRDQFQLAFDFRRNSVRAYRLKKDGQNIEKQPFGEERSLEPWKLREIDLEGKGQFRSGEVLVRIFPLGWMEQVSVILMTPAGEEKILAFSPLTGSMKIADGRQKL